MPTELFREIHLTQGMVAIVDLVDYESLIQFKWRATISKRPRVGTVWYATRHLGRTSISMHRQILTPPPGMLVDHRDGDGLNCRRSNLRLATHRQNMQNRRHYIFTDGKRSAYKGLFVNGSGWAARLGGKYLGTFRTETDAALAYDRAARRMCGEFAVVNFPTHTE